MSSPLSRLTLALLILPILTSIGCRNPAGQGVDGEGGPPIATWESSAEAMATIPPSPAPRDGLPASIDVDTLVRLREDDQVLVLDVREPDEYEEAHIPGVVLIPVSEMPDRLAEIPKDRTVILTCRSGNRSQQAATFLRGKGYTDVHNMTGGILAWQKAGLPTESGAP